MTVTSSYTRLNGEPLLPVDWRRLRLGDVATFINGDRGRNYPSPSDFVNDGVPFINAGHLNGRTVDFAGMNFITEASFQALGSGKVQKGDILYCLRGSLGKTAVITFEDAAAIASSLVIIRCSDDVDVRFIHRYLACPLGQGEISRFNNGSSQPNLSATSVKEYEIPLPPLSEQKRIADILDKADAIRRKREDGIRLTEELLRSTFLEIFGDPVANERGWPRKPFLEILDNIDSGWSPKCHDRQAQGDEWAVLKLGAVTYCKYQPEENKALPESEQPISDLEVKKGDLLLTRKNTYDLVAASAFVFETPPRLMLPDLIFRLRIKEKAPVRAEYLWGLLTHPGKRRSIQSLAGGSAGSMPNISKAKLLSHLIELPPKPLQDKFAELMHTHYRMKCKRQELVAEQSSMFDALVQRAFRGEL